MEREKARSGGGGYTRLRLRSVQYIIVLFNLPQYARGARLDISNKKLFPKF